MAELEIHSLLSSDKRFTKCGKQLFNTAINIDSFIDNIEIQEAINENIFGIRNLVHLLNVLQYANVNKDSFVNHNFNKSEIHELVKSKDLIFEKIFSYDIDELVLKDTLKENYIDYHDVVLHSANESDKELLSAFLKPSKGNNTKKSTITGSKSSSSKSQKSKKPKAKLAELNFDSHDEDLWIQSVRLDLPFIPQPDITDISNRFEEHENNYCIYGEANLPWFQCQITCKTDVDKFKTKDVLKLFPPIRLYTRSPYMYKKYDGLQFDNDLGILFNIEGFTLEQIRTNIIEYPHIDLLTRIVKMDDKESAIPFWKHIEIDGEMFSTSKIWDELDDTKKLPKTESFMNEYVVRRYLLNRDYNETEFKYPLFGSLDKFLTLYAPIRYYQNIGYNVEDIGRQCIKARQQFKASRNPILRMSNS